MKPCKLLAPLRRGTPRQIREEGDLTSHTNSFKFEIQMLEIVPKEECITANETNVLKTKITINFEHTDYLFSF